MIRRPPRRRVGRSRASVAPPRSGDPLTGRIRAPVTMERAEHLHLLFFWKSMLNSPHMSRHTISQSLWLRNRPFSLLDGATAVFDCRPFTYNYNISPAPQAADARAIASDLYAVGDDMRAALAEYGRTQ